MAATIKIKNSSTSGAVPTASDLVQGELAVNVTDKRIFTENASGTVVELGTNPTILTLPDGSASAPTLTNDGDTNTGLFFPAADTVGITTGGTERARVDSSGNLGLGVTPSAWSLGKAIEVGFIGKGIWANNQNEVIFPNNAYYNGGWKYSVSSYQPSQYAQRDGLHAWYNAASGTAGNAITFTQAMTLDASGNLGVGTTSPSERLSVVTTSGRASIFLAGGTANQGYISYFNSTQLLSLGCGEPTGTGTNKGQQVNIDSSGNLLVNLTSQVVSGTLCVKNASTKNGIVSQDSGSSNYLYQGINSVATNVFIVAANGNVTNTNNSYGAISDVKLKENITDATPKLEQLNQVRVVNYTLKSEPEHKQLGVIAQELEQIFPGMVDETIDRDEEGNDLGTTTKSVKYSVFVPILIKAIQELKAEFDAYKASHP